MRLSTKLALGALVLAVLPRRRPRPAVAAAGADGAVTLAAADAVPPSVVPPELPPAHDGDDHLASPPSGLRAAVMSGLVWKALSILVKQGSRVIVGIVLARLLTPEDYGLAALVLVFSSLVFIFSDLSLGAALVQRARITEKDRSTVFWVSVAAGVVCTLVGFAVAGLVADFYREPDVKPLFMAVSISFVIVSLGVTQEALLTRAMDFRSLEIRQMAAALAGAVVAVVSRRGAAAPGRSSSSRWSWSPSPP